MSSSVPVTCPIHRHAQARPDALALWAPARRWTFAELDAAVEATGSRLSAQGVRTGTRVALRLPRGPEYVILLWAVWRRGAVAVPMSTRLPIERVGRTARQAGAEVIISDDDPVRAASPEALDGLRVDEVTVTRASESTAPLKQPLQRPATIIYTSGSTGSPKAALHTWANHVYNAKGANANIPVRNGDRWLLSLPLYHVGGLAILIRCALGGAAVATPGRDRSLASALEAAGATHVSLVATQFRRLLDETGGSLPGRLRTVLLGGGPLPGSLIRRGHDQGWPLHTSYGSTEMASQVTTTPPGASLGDLRTAGRLLPHRRLRIGADGQIYVGGPSLFSGYVEGGDLHDPRIEAGWYPTSDCGNLDAQGRLRVQGRMDRQFVSGGENLQPEEIEAALEQLSEVERAVVVPVPNAEYGQRPVAFVQVKEESLPSRWEARLEATLPRFKIPDALFPLPKSTRQHRMKIDRAALRRRAQKLYDAAAG